MATILDTHWPQIRDAVKARIKAIGTAQVKSVINSLILDHTIIWDSNSMHISDEETQSIIAPLLEKGEYQSILIGAETYISKNPSFELSENVKLTNDSIRRLNSSLKWTNVLSLAIACITTLFIILTYIKDHTNYNEAIGTRMNALEVRLGKMDNFKTSVDSIIMLKSNNLKNSPTILPTDTNKKPIKY